MADVSRQGVVADRERLGGQNVNDPKQTLSLWDKWATMKIVENRRAKRCNRNAYSTKLKSCSATPYPPLPSPPLLSLASPVRHLLFLPASRSKINMYFLSDIFYAFDNCHFRAQSTETTNTRNQIRNRISSLESEILESRS